jgi:DNA invertase Pin-like site-specific DNA recombinase
MPAFRPPNQTCENQLRDLREFAARRGWESVEFIDQGFSGTRERRPALDQMLDQVKKRRFDVVLIWRFDRFARSTKFLVEALALFKSLGVQFASFQENLDSSTPMGEAMFTIVAAISKLERDVCAERIRASLRRARAEGKGLGRAPLNIPAHRVDDVVRRGLSARAAARELGVSVASA